MTATLAIDTASDTFAVALGRDGVTERLVEGVSGQDHSRLLLAAIDEVTGGDRSVIERIVVTRGPGSYTGLRVGSATAQGLGLALDVPVRGIPTLLLVATAADIGEVMTIHPAGRGDFAIQPFRAAVATADRSIAAADALAASALPLTGEGAGALGGIELGAADRVRAALQLDAAASESETAEPIYLREPHITRPRRPFGEPAPTR